MNGIAPHTNKLASMRMARALTQAQLADRIGCRQQHISRWERGERTPGAKSLRALAEALECTIDEII